MSQRYDHDAVEAKWQKKWEEARCFEASEDHSKPKFYGLIVADKVLFMASPKWTGASVRSHW